MKTVKQLRTQLGMSQVDMATYLGINRTALAHAEKGRASLLVPALKKLATLEKALIKTTGHDSSNEIPGNDMLSLIRGYELREQTCIYESQLLQRKLEELDEQYNTAHQLYNVLKELDHDKDGDPRWLKEMKHKTTMKLSTCTIPIREGLRNKISHLLNEAAQIRQYLEDKRSVL